MSADWYPGIKAFCAHWSHAPMLQQTLETLEQEFADDNDACIDAAKAIVECACRLLIEELDDPINPIKEWPGSPLTKAIVTTNEWLSATNRLLKVVADHNDLFNKVVSQHNELASQLNVFRNKAGSISHGRIGTSDRLSKHHRRAALLAADAIISYLHEIYLELEPDPAKTLEPYERFARSNETIDSFAAIRAVTDEDGVLSAIVLLPDGEEILLTIEPSRLLFGVDRVAYKAALDACREAKASTTEEPIDEEVV
jgi:hypothetical protein